MKFEKWIQRAAALIKHRSHDDGRSRRVVAVIECVINQNVRDCGAACAPAVNEAFLALCVRYRAGIIQIPCPEQAALGLDRLRPKGVTLRSAMEAPASRRSCSQIAELIVHRLSEHLNSGNEVLAVFGGNPQSPGCAVHPEDGACALAYGDAQAGILIQELSACLRRQGLSIPIVPMRDSDPALLKHDLARAESLLKAGQQKGTGS